MEGCRRNNICIKLGISHVLLPELSLKKGNFLKRIVTMFRKFENFSFVSLFLSGILLLAGLEPSPASGGDDVLLSEVPKAVRDTIERETKGFEFEDIDRDNDGGKIVYKVDSESADGRENHLLVAEDGSLLKKEEQLRGKDLPALIGTAVKKSVGDIVFYRIRRKVSSSGDVRYEIIGDKIDAEINLVLAGDGSIIDRKVKPIDRNKIKGNGGLGRCRELLIKLRYQLKVAAIGDSRGMHGINARYFLGEENKKFPMAMNFSTSGAGLGRCVAVIEDYLPLAPNLEWVVYGISPRIFNKYYEGWGEESIRNNSALYRTDRMGWGVWQQVNTKPVPASAIKGDVSGPLGYEVKYAVRHDDFEDADDIRKVRRRLRRGRYEFDNKRLRIFESMIKVLAKRKVKLLAFTPPIHPVSAGQPCTDDDGTTREAYDELVAKMKGFEKKYPNFHFADVNNKGRHKLAGTDFDDFDHLNDQGAKKLTLMLNNIMKTIDSTHLHQESHTTAERDFSR